MGKKVLELELGEIIRLYRERARLSKTDVAKAIGVTPATINNYETNRTPLSYKKMLKFREVLGEDFEYALKIIEEEDGNFDGRISINDVNALYQLRFPRLYKVILYLARLDGLTAEEAFIKYGVYLRETEIRIADEKDVDTLVLHDKHIKQEDLSAAIQQNRVYIIEENGVFAGWLRYSLFWDSIPFMNMLYLIDNMRGKGYGRQLVGKWEEEMNKHGYNTVMTSTQSNEQAQHFYMHLEYKAIGGFALDREPYEIIMSKQLK